MDQIIAILNDAFGPVGAVVLAGVGFWGWQGHKAKDASQEKRIEENRQHAKELFETIGAIREIKSSLERLNT